MAETTVPRLSARWTVVAHDADTVEFRTGVWNSRNVTLQDEERRGILWPAVTLLKNGVAPKEIARTVGVRAGDLNDTLDNMRDLGLVVDAPESALDAYLEEAPSLGHDDGFRFDRVVLTGDPSMVANVRSQLDASLRQPRIDVVEFPSAPSAAGYAAWEDSLVREGEAEKYLPYRRSLMVAVTASNDPDRFRFLDLVASMVGFTWLHATIDGPFLFVGPTVIPGQSASYRDFESRVAMNLRERESYLKFKSALASERHLKAHGNVVPPLASLVASFTALEVVNLVECGTAPTLNKVLSIYVPTMEIAYQEVLPLPGGEDGPFARRDATALYFDAREWLLDPRLDAE
ncbi:hypothetical protein [Virgisporangium aurantiacum]|uniref:Uncharacterized protein n=1 Tax=Virgisporangium aurantiacum TaxID=175570 RepID=A0A8J4E695_9ACTN|nr:hypothetical protein [Virgisporangium aurantiacum]GIJ63835.1 hypothetical protein Vau01_113510 [Virgisporangium aurantiacum]